MRSVFLLLGNTSQELDSWPDIVIQLNKIGKDNTKRRIQCRIPEDIDFIAAKKVHKCFDINNVKGRHYWVISIEHMKQAKNKFMYLKIHPDWHLAILTSVSYFSGGAHSLQV